MTYTDYLLLPSSEMIPNDENQVEMKKIECQNNFDTALRRALNAYGMISLRKTDSEISRILYPPGINDREFKERLKNKKVIIIDEVEHLAKKTFNIESMDNHTSEKIEKLIKQVGEVLEEMGHRVTIGAALKACREILAVKK